MILYLQKKIINFLFLGLLYTVGTYAVNPTLTPRSNELTDIQLSAFLGIVTNFILSDDILDSSNIKKEAIAKIAKYADTAKNPPTIQDYLKAGVVGVTSTNIASINKAIKATSSSHINTRAKIQALVNKVLSIDKTPPVITLKGKANITLNIGKNYIEMGATAIDNRDGDVTSKIQRTGSVNTKKIGTYTISYNVHDNAGNKAIEVKRVVTVMQRVLKTGQTIIYNDGDDGDYQMGERRSYISYYEDVIVDMATGLMWQDNSEVKTVTKPWVTKANYDKKDYNNTSGDTATTYCSNLTLGGHTDWRLPNRKELTTIIDYSRGFPAIDPIFSNIVSNFYWLTNINHYNSKKAWLISFKDGVQHGDYSKVGSYYVRCVRNYF